MVPVELGCYALGGVVGLLQLVGAPKGRDRLVHPPDPAQVVAPHVVRVRDCRREPRERLPVLEGQRDLPHGLVRVGQVVVSGGVVRGEPQRLAVEGGGRGPASLAAAGRRRFLGVAAHQPQLDVADVDRERVVDRLLVSGVPGRIGEVGHGLELLRPERDAPLLARARAGGERLRLHERAAGGLGVVQARVDAGEAEPRHGELRVDTQRLTERARRLDPDVSVQVVQPLVV